MVTGCLNSAPMDQATIKFHCKFGICGIYAPFKVNTDRCHMTFVPLKMQNLRPVSKKSIIKK